MKFSRPTEVYLVASGDARQSANEKCWPAQKSMESSIIKVLEKEGVKVIRLPEYDEKLKHGFIHSQRQGLDIFSKMDKTKPVIVAEAVWQYSYHVVGGLRDHMGAILTIANWSGEWPGLVGLLNLNASLTKMGVHYSTIWSKDFSDDFFLNGMKSWLEDGEIKHDLSHVSPLSLENFEESNVKMGETLADELRAKKAIMGIFDEGCMGMYNAIFDDELLNTIGIYKERLSQAYLLAEMEQVSDAEANNIYTWLKNQGMKFNLGKDENNELTENQILSQCKMYIAAVRIADAFKCDVIGIQYQLGLVQSCPASDLPEGMMNNRNRPPVFDKEGKVELFKGQPVPHFNEVDQGCAVDTLITNRVWNALNFDPATTLHDIRWGELYKDHNIDDFVWVFEISGSVPPSHFENEYKDASGERQPAMYFPKGGSTIKGVSKPGSIVWSRVYIEDKCLNVDVGIGKVLKLPQEEVEKRWKNTTSEWPIMNVVLSGVTRDQLMAKHKSNHIQVAYTPSRAEARRSLEVKSAMFNKLGLRVNICGEI